VLNNVEPVKESGKSKRQRRSTQIRLNVIKCWTDADGDAPQFTTIDQFEIAKSLVLKVS